MSFLHLKTDKWAWAGQLRGRRCCRLCAYSRPVITVPDKEQKHQTKPTHDLWRSGRFGWDSLVCLIFMLRRHILICHFLDSARVVGGEENSTSKRIPKSSSPHKRPPLSHSFSVCRVGVARGQDQGKASPLSLLDAVLVHSCNLRSRQRVSGSLSVFLLKQQGKTRLLALALPSSVSRHDGCAPVGPLTLRLGILPPVRPARGLGPCVSVFVCPSPPQFSA
jgi:hypothetical protein